MCIADNQTLIFISRCNKMVSICSNGKGSILFL